MKALQKGGMELDLNMLELRGKKQEEEELFLVKTKVRLKKLLIS